MQQEDMGIQFGKYTVFSKLAVGGMAEVYLAKQAALGGYSRTIALKCILPHLAQEDQFVTMFLDEARVASQLNHPNVVQIYEIGQVEGVYYIAMEYIRGQNLKQFGKRLFSLENPPSPYSLSAGILAQAAAGLHYAHNATDDAGRPLNIVHRDVSPNNLILAYNGILKLLDFGVAKAAVQEHQTRAGMVKGKYRYMSPEQLAGQRVDRRSDIFSLGIVLYELSTNVGLFKRRTEAETIRAIHQDPILPPSTFDNRYPRELERIVMRSLERDLSARFQDAEEMRLALDAFIQGSGSYYSSRQIGDMMGVLFAQEQEDDRLGTSAKPLSKSDLKRFSNLADIVSGEATQDSSPSHPSPIYISSSDAFPQVQPPAHSHNHHHAPHAPKSTANRVSSIVSWILLALLFIAIGVTAAWLIARSPSSRFPDPTVQMKEIQSLVRERRYFDASNLLHRFSQDPRSASYSLWVRQIKERIAIGPRMDIAQQLYKGKDYRAAYSVLAQLLAQFPDADPVHALINRVKLHLDPSPTKRDEPRKYRHR